MNTSPVTLFQAKDESWIILIDGRVIWLGWDQDEARQQFLSTFEASRCRN